MLTTLLGDLLLYTFIGRRELTFVFPWKQILAVGCGVLLLLLFFDAQLRPRLHVRGEAQGPALVAGETGHQLAVGEHLPGIQHPGLQKLRLPKNAFTASVQPPKP